MFGREEREQKKHMAQRIDEAKKMAQFHRMLERAITAGERSLRDIEATIHDLPPIRNLPRGRTPLESAQVSRALTELKKAKEVIRRSDAALAKFTPEMSMREFLDTALAISEEFRPLYESLTVTVRNGKVTYAGFAGREYRSANLDRDTAKLKSALENLRPLHDAADLCHFAWRTVGGKPDTRGMV